MRMDPKQAHTTLMHEKLTHKKLMHKKLLQHPNLWRAGQMGERQAQSQAGIPTGFTLLDEQLPGAGWPNAGLAELMLGSAGIGELRLLVPALHAMSQQQNRWVAWINPPFVPYAPALQAVGIDISKILLIHPRSHLDALWALERACRSGSCSSALAWLDEKKLKLKDTQRLQVAAKQGRTFTCLFRPQSACAHSSMAELRLALRAATPGQVELDILKRRGGWPLHNLVLPVAEATGTAHREAEDIQQQLILWRAFQTHSEIAHSDASLTSDAPERRPLLPFSRATRTPRMHVH